jgi:beta-lactamase regulating signal transducer with metallopeptidase domain
MLLRICASIYWFNPFLLIMLKEADKDIENLCDTAVVRRVNKNEHKLYRQLLLRTVAMENQIPYVTASLNDSEMVFKDRILYMVNIRKLRRGILPGILMTMLLAGGNLVFNVSAGTDTVSVETEKSGMKKMQSQRKIMYRIMHRFLKW